MGSMSNSVVLRQYLNEGLPGPEHFGVQKGDDPRGTPLADGSILVSVHHMSADPYMRNRLRDSSTFGSTTKMVTFTVGEPLFGFVSGVVLESKSSDWGPGDLFGGLLPF